MNQDEKTWGQLLAATALGFVSLPIYLFFLFVVIRYVLVPSDFLQRLGCKPIVLRVRVDTGNGDQKTAGNEFVNAECQLCYSDNVEVGGNIPAASHNKRTKIVSGNLDEVLAGIARKNCRPEKQDIIIGKAATLPIGESTPSLRCPPKQ